MAFFLNKLVIPPGHIWLHGLGRKALANKDLNQVVASSGFSKNKGLGGVLSLAGS